MPATHHAPVLILGSGPAGLTAAIYAARAALRPMLVAGMQPGGQMTITTDVENYPGFAQTIQGPWLMEQMQKQAEHVGTRFVSDQIVAADLSRRPFACTGDSGDVYTGDALIVATGASARWLGIPGEEALRGFGVSACATCDGFFFRGKKVAVVGGGNTAVEEALFLTNHAQHVTLIHRRDSLRAEKIMQARLFANPKVSVVWDTAVEAAEGSGAPGGEGRPNEKSGAGNSVGAMGFGASAPAALASVKLRNLKTGASSTLALDGLFVAIGHTPNTGLFKGQLKMDREGYLVTRPGSTETDIPGVFATGDVQDRVFRQAVTAAGTGCMGAIEAGHFLAHAAAAARAAPVGVHSHDAMTANARK
ncbi:MAG: thioredoxin-disulfide reductase [Rhodospirillales bacterium]|nr:thioredoxin-disulfide reductase [Rhodospirillales bacterium]